MKKYCSSIHMLWCSTQIMIILVNACACPQFTILDQGIDRVVLEKYFIRLMFFLTLSDHPESKASFKWQQYIQIFLVYKMIIKVLLIAIKLAHSFPRPEDLHFNSFMSVDLISDIVLHEDENFFSGHSSKPWGAKLQWDGTPDWRRYCSR